MLVLNKTNKKIGAIIRRHRTMNNYTQQYLAKKINVRPATISNYEIGYSKPNTKNAKLLSELFNIPVELLLGYDGNSGYLAEMKNQEFIKKNDIPYYDSTNFLGISEADLAYADSYLVYPCKEILNTAKMFCTSVTDNSMSYSGISKNSYVIINRNIRPCNGDIVGVIDTKAKKFFIRKFISEGPVINLLTDGPTNDETIFTSLDDDNYKITGVVTDAIIKIRKSRNM